MSGIMLQVNNAANGSNAAAAPAAVAASAPTAAPVTTVADKTATAVPTVTASVPAVDPKPAAASPETLQPPAPPGKPESSTTSTSTTTAAPVTTTTSTAAALSAKAQPESVKTTSAPVVTATSVAPPVLPSAGATAPVVTTIRVPTSAPALVKLPTQPHPQSSATTIVPVAPGTSATGAHHPVTTMMAVPALHQQQVTIATARAIPPEQRTIVQPRAQLITGQQHVVQHHPPPLRMVQIPSAVQVSAANVSQRVPGLPQNPISIRHALPQAPLTRAVASNTIGVPQLPRSPVRHPQLPQTPLLRQSLHPMQATPIGGARLPSSIAALASGQVQQRHLATRTTGGTTVVQDLQVTRSNCIMVSQRAHSLMLPQTPATPLQLATNQTPVLSNAAGSHIITLPAQPAQRLQSLVQSPQLAAVVQPKQAVPVQQAVKQQPTILPPNTLHHLLSSSHLPDDDLDVSDVEPPPPPRGRTLLASPRQQRDRRTLPCQLALQDHNYYTRPPPTPPPPSKSPPPSQPAILRNVLQTQNQSFTASSASALQGVNHLVSAAAAITSADKAAAASSGPIRLPQYTPTSQSMAAAMVAVASQPVGLANAVNGPPGSNAVVSGSNVLPSRVEAHFRSIKEAGVGPMAPLTVDDDNSQSSGGSSHDDRGGEDTETAPEAEDDSITRCICDFLHDDGYMICCDKCSVWQHVVCMGLDRNNIPDEYLCEICKPRLVDRKRAKALQSRRRNELFNRSSSSDDDVKDRKNKPDAKKNNKPSKKSVMKVVSGSLINKKKFMANKAASKIKQARKRKPSEKDGKVTRINLKQRRKSQTSLSNESNVDLDDDEDEDIELEAKPIDASQQLRAWIDQYEEAVTNHYSPELRARLASNKLNGVTSDLRPSVIGSLTRCNVSLQGNGVKILTASNNLTSNTPIIECKGKLMLATQYRLQNKTKASNPYVFYYQLSDNLEIALDGKTYGNDSRFCRRSTDYNAELKHVIDKGSLHLFIITLKSIEKNQEILLAPDSSYTPQHPLQSINADLREIKKPINGTMTDADDEPLSSTRNENDARTKKVAKKMPKKKVLKKKAKKVVKKVIKKVKKAIHNEPKVNGDIKSDDEDDEEEEEPKPLKKKSSPPPTSPTRPTKPSPAKLGLPDSSGLIVGVNTINYDASSSLRNKAKSREERKMEMIMKAFEAMEKAEQKKREDGGTGTHVSQKTESNKVTANKRRRSSSATGKNSAGTDSNLDASSADEGKDVPAKKSRKKGRRSGPVTPKRRRSRVASGGSASAMSGDDTNVDGSGFRFPKTKKALMSEWLQESENADEDDVSANYLRGSRSPPGIATHLLRSSAQTSAHPMTSPLVQQPPTIASPVKVCSAKKRWLRQAISEDQNEEVNGAGSPVEPSFSDCVTPLKKRRLQNYKEEQSAMETKTEPVEQVHNGIKKKMLHNLVLEAVLDRAMEDMLERKATADLPSKTEPKEEPATAATAAASEGPAAIPEPSSVFKSFFKSNNSSLEALEAELEATRKQREAEQQKHQKQLVDLHSDEASMTPPPAPPAAIPSPVVSIPAAMVDKLEIEANIKQEYSPPLPPPAVSEDSNPTKLDADKIRGEMELVTECKPELKEPEVTTLKVETPVAADHPSQLKTEEPEPQAEFPEMKTEENVPPATVVSTPPPLSSKPKEKKRFSLADYKRRRQQEATTDVPHEKIESTKPEPAPPQPLSPALPPIAEPSKPSSTVTLLPASLAEIPLPSVPSSDGKIEIPEEDGSGTPTLDEQVANLTAPATLNTLHVLAKFDKLEKVQNEIKKKAQTIIGDQNSSSVSPQVPPKREDIPEPKREDLTERLKKEFGLSIDAPETPVPAPTDGDATPEEDSGKAVAVNNTSSYLPTQYPSYPPNYPQIPPQNFRAPPPTLLPSTNLSVPPPVNVHQAPPGNGPYQQPPQSVPVMNYPPPLPPASVLANAPHPPSRTEREESRSSGSRSNSSGNKDYYNNSSSSHWSNSGPNRTGGGAGGGGGGRYYSSRSFQDQRDKRDRDYRREYDRTRGDRDGERHPRDRDLRDHHHYSSHRSSSRDTDSRRKNYGRDRYY